VTVTNTTVVRDAVAAILRQDLRLVAEILHPDVEWVWFEPGGTDCRGRDAVIEAFRERIADAVMGPVREVFEHGDDVIVSMAPSVTASAWGATESWTRVVLRDERVVRLISYDTRERALDGL
jgi:ketosteroid isomerase-like protein